jgi:hypothetical protein
MSNQRRTDDIDPRWLAGYMTRTGRKPPYATKDWQALRNAWRQYKHKQKANQELAEMKAKLIELEDN